MSNTVYRLGMLDYHKKELSENYNISEQQNNKGSNQNNQSNQGNQNNQNYQSNNTQIDQDTNQPVINKGDIEFRNLSFKYNPDSEEYVLKNINLIIPKNQKLGILGRSGSGKST